jgi:hypothetical protein
MVRLSKVENFWLEDGASKIELAGSFLGEHGFVEGAQIVVEMKNKEIIIKLVDEEE